MLLLHSMWAAWALFAYIVFGIWQPFWLTACQDTGLVYPVAGFSDAHVVVGYIRNYMQRTMASFWQAALCGASS